MAHHKHTNDPARDPELSSPKPDTGVALVWHLSAIGYWRDKLLTLWQNATGPNDARYISDRSRPLIRREARLYILIDIIPLATLIWSPMILWLWLIPLASGFPVLRLYLLAEHGRCPQVADMFANSRTTLTTRAIRFVAWNMPYHAEHHAWPMVPFHALPRLHRLTRPHLKTLSQGYGAFTRDTLDQIRR